MKKNSLSTYYEARWIATIAVGFITTVLFGAIVALLSPLTGWVGDGIEFLLAASASAYFVRTILCMKIMQRKLFSPRN